MKAKRRDSTEQGITNRPLLEEQRQQKKLGPRLDDQAGQDGIERGGTPEAQSSAGKTGLRSGSMKRVTANRGGIAPGKTRPKSGAHGRSDRRPEDTVRTRREQAVAVPSARAKAKAKVPRSKSRTRAA